MKMKMKNKKYIIVIAIILTLVIFVGFNNQNTEATTAQTHTQDGSDDSPQRDQSNATRTGDKPSEETSSREEINPSAASAIPIEVLPVTLQSISDEYRAIGKVSPYKEVTIGSSSSGIIKTINVGVGDIVSEGDIIYTTDNDTVEASNDQQLTSALNNESSAQLKYDDAKKNYENLSELYEIGAISKSDLDSAEIAMQTAKITYENALSSYNSTLDISNISNANTVLKAPIDGIVSAINVQEGEKSGVSDITIIDTTYYIVDTIATGKIVEDIAVGDDVNVVYEESTIKGTIKEISPVGINGTDSYSVKVQIQDTNNVLAIGFNVNVYYYLNKTENQIVVPKKSILTDSYGDYVYVVTDMLAKKIYIEQGFTNNGFVQITGDIVEGTNIIIGGQTLVTDGDAVKITQN